jgi:hypothetical protein
MSSIKERWINQSLTDKKVGIALVISLVICVTFVTFGTAAPPATFVYSSEPPQDWLDGCMDYARLFNLKYANARAKYNLRDGYMPPEYCRELWKNPEGQRQWHAYSPEQRRKSIWLDPVARQENVRKMPELN